MKKKSLFRLTYFILFACLFQSCYEEKKFDYNEEIFLNYTKLNLYYGDKVTVTVSPLSAAYEWSSGDPSIAQVNSSGEVEAKGVGETYITATTKDGTVSKEITVVVTIPKADNIIGRSGKYRAAVELDIRSELIKAVKIVRTDTDESSTTDINFGQGTFTVFYDGLDEGRYTFNVICIDKYGMESVPTELRIQVYGDEYNNRVKNRAFRAAAALGGGFCIDWSSTEGDYVIVRYTDKNGNPASKEIKANIDSNILDYLFDPITVISYQTVFIPDANCIDAFYSEITTVPVESIQDKRYFLKNTGACEIRTRDFDLGGEGVGYHEKSESDANRPGNRAYRPTLGDLNGQGPDIEGQNNFGYTQNDSWFNYTVYIEKAGNYAFDVQIGVNSSSQSTYYLKLDGSRLTDNTILRNMGTWSQSWYYSGWTVNNLPIEANPVVYLPQGLHTITWYYVIANSNLNALKFTYVGN